MWTNTAAERGHTHAVVVELAPRWSRVWQRSLSGVWQRQEVVNRSVSACEINSRERPVVDAFTRQCARLCAPPTDAEIEQEKNEFWRMLGLPMA